MVEITIVMCLGAQKVYLLTMCHHREGLEAVFHIHFDLEIHLVGH